MDAICQWYKDMQDQGIPGIMIEDLGDPDIKRRIAYSERFFSVTRGVEDYRGVPATKVTVKKAFTYSNPAYNLEIRIPAGASLFFTLTEVDGLYRIHFSQSMCIAHRGNFDLASNSLPLLVLYAFGRTLDVMCDGGYIIAGKDLHLGTANCKATRTTRTV